MHGDVLLQGDRVPVVTTGKKPRRADAPHRGGLNFSEQAHLDLLKTVADAATGCWVRRRASARGERAGDPV
jgi:hypothetical protein